MIIELEDFLNTETKRKIFLCYMLGPKSQTEIYQNLKKDMSLSSIDRTTTILNYMKIIKRGEIKNNRQVYFVNWNLWILEFLKQMNLKDISEETIASMADTISKPEVISYFFYISHPKVVRAFLEKMKLKKSLGDFEESFYEYILKSFSRGNLASYPLFFLLKGSPIESLIKTFHQDIELNNEDIKEFPQIFKKIYSESKEMGIKYLSPDVIKKAKEDIESVKEEMKKIWEKHMKKEIEKESENEKD